MNLNALPSTPIKRRWSNRWYFTVLLLALLVFGLRGLDGLGDDHLAVQISVYPAQSDRILL